MTPPHPPHLWSTGALWSVAMSHRVRGGGFGECALIRGDCRLLAYSTSLDNTTWSMCENMCVRECDVIVSTLPTLVHLEKRREDSVW